MDGWVDGRVDGWLDRRVLGWMGMDRGMALEAGGPIREVTLVQEKKDEGLGGGQRRADLRDSSPGEMRILKTS